MVLHYSILMFSTGCENFLIVEKKLGTVKRLKFVSSEDSTDKQINW